MRTHGTRHTTRGTLTFAVLLLVSAVLLCATPPSAYAQSCLPGRYLLPQGALVAGAEPGVADALELDAGAVAVPGLCEPVQPRRVKTTGRGATRIRARWPAGACSTLQGRVRLKVKIGPDCTYLIGSLRERGRGHKFEGSRSRCGDRVVDAGGGETCEPPRDGSPGRGVCAVGEGCTTDCVCGVLAPVCGDGMRQGDEECDGDDLGGATCADAVPGGHGSALGCTEGCRFETRACHVCGDLQIDPGEECDDVSVPTGCSALGFDGGQLGCGPDCTLDTRACCVCGNGVREPDCGEACDGDDVGEATCANIGFGLPGGGTLACFPGCSFDPRECHLCGNGRKEGAEECDFLDFGGAACDAPGETGGSLLCTDDCTVDREPCWRCGNGRHDPGEQCDDGNAIALDGCGPDCLLECGNGTVEPNEECDDGNATGGDGCHFCGLGDTYDGGGDHQIECALIWSLSGPPLPAAAISCGDGDPACDQDDLTGECTLRFFYCFNRPPWVSGGALPACAPTNVASVTLTDPSLVGPAALDPDARDALLDAMAATASRSSMVDRTGTQLVVSPPLLAPHACGVFLLGVPQGAERAGGQG